MSSKAALIAEMVKAEDEGNLPGASETTRFTWLFLSTRILIIIGVAITSIFPGGGRWLNYSVCIRIHHTAYAVAHVWQ